MNNSSGLGAYHLRTLISAPVRKNARKLRSSSGDSATAVWRPISFLSVPGLSEVLRRLGGPLGPGAKRGERQRDAAKLGRQEGIRFLSGLPMLSCRRNDAHSKIRDSIFLADSEPGRGFCGFAYAQ
jgi:hypothetical protein